MASFDRSLLRVKQDLEHYLPASAIAAAATAAGHRWRRRLPDPALTVHLFILQVLNFNTSLTHLTHLAVRFGAKPITPSALCQARARLPLAVLQKLLRSVCGAAGATGLFHGHKLWTVDGAWGVRRLRTATSFAIILTNRQIRASNPQGLVHAT